MSVEPGIRLSAPQAVITHGAALRAVTAATEAAAALGVRVNVAVVDAGGVLAGFVRMPGAPLHSIEIAIDKAYTAVSFGLETAAWAQALRGHSEAVREGLVLRPRFVAFGGGVPVVADGQRIGAIGVSGGSEEQDGAIARAALGALGLA
jgi:uncharacterized protein GlcG (DUF336 family)